MAVGVAVGLVVGDGVVVVGLIDGDGDVDGTVVGRTEVGGVGLGCEQPTRPTVNKTIIRAVRVARSLTIVTPPGLLLRDII